MRVDNVGVNLAGALDAFTSLQRRHGFRVTNALLYVVSNGLQRGATVLVTPLLLGRLSVAEYGQYGLLLSIYVLGPAVLSLGLYGAIGRFYFDSTDAAQRRRTSSALLIGHAASVVVLAGIIDLSLRWTVASVGNIRFQPYIELTLWAAAAAALYEGVTAYWRAAERPVIVVSANLAAVTAIITGIAFFLLVADLGLRGVLLGMLAGQGLIAIVAFALTIRTTGVSWDGKAIRGALVFSVPLVPYIMSGWLLRSSDRWILEHFRNTAEVGVYFLSVQLASVISLVMLSTNDAIAPRLLAHYRDHQAEGARAFHRRIFPIYCWLGVILAAGVILAGPWAASLLSHGKIVHVMPVLAILAAAMVASGLYVPFGNAFFALKRSRGLLLLTLATGLLDVTLNLVLVPRVGAAGAATSMLLSFCVLLGLAMTFAHRSLGLQRFPGHLAAAAAVLALATWVAGGHPLP